MCYVIHGYILVQCYVVSLSGDGMLAAVQLKRPSVLINEHTTEDMRWPLLENIRKPFSIRVVKTIVM